MQDAGTNRDSARSAQPSRERILIAARSIFAARGYERATVRAIAKLADINPALVIRYYGSKEGLFAAAATFDLKLPSSEHVDPAMIGTRLVSHFLDRWEGEHADGDLQILLRASVTQEAARVRMREIFETQLAEATAKIGDPANAMQRAGLIASQMLGLALGRYILLLPGLVDMPRENIIRDVGATIQRYLTDANPRSS